MKKVLWKEVLSLFRFVLCCTLQIAMLGNFNFKKSGGARAPPGPNDATPMLKLRITINIIEIIPKILRRWWGGGQIPKLAVWYGLINYWRWLNINRCEERSMSISHSYLLLETPHSAIKLWLLLNFIILICNIRLRCESPLISIQLQLFNWKHSFLFTIFVSSRVIENMSLRLQVCTRIFTRIPAPHVSVVVIPQLYVVQYTLRFCNRICWMLILAFVSSLVLCGLLHSVRILGQNEYVRVYSYPDGAVISCLLSLES